MKLRVMSYNIENGGLLFYKKSGNMNYVKKYIDLIRSNRIDIISFQECKMRDVDISKIVAEKLGYFHKYFFDKTDFYTKKYYHQAIISKYPIVYSDEITNVCGVMVKGVVVNIVNIHLDDEPYIPYSIKGVEYTNTPSNIKSNSDKVDLSFVTKRYTVTTLMDDKRVLTEPTIIMGDFNEPSHLDYEKVKWKTSKYIMKHGFVDVARSIYSDVKKYPLYTVDLYDEKYPAERIDIMYCNRGLKPVKYSNMYKYSDLSDHIPIVGEFELKTGKANATRKNRKL